MKIFEGTLVPEVRDSQGHVTEVPERNLLRDIKKKYGEQQLLTHQ